MNSVKYKLNWYRRINFTYAVSKYKKHKHTMSSAGADGYFLNMQVACK